MPLLLAATLMLDAPDWPVLLGCCAAAALGYEALAAMRSWRRPRVSAPRLAVAAVLGAMAFFWGNAGCIVALAGCCLAWAVRSYSRTTSPIHPAHKLALLTLRALVILLLALWILRPTLEYRTWRPLPGLVLVGVDTSASMQRRDMSTSFIPAEGPGAISRIDAVRQMMPKQADQFARLTEHSDLDLFSFAQSAKPQAFVPARSTSSADIPRKVFDWPDATGLATALGDSLARELAPYNQAGRDVSAVLLISDGCNNTSDVVTPLKQAELLGSRGVPIYTVGVGSDQVTLATRTMSVKDLQSPEQVEIFNRLPISAAVDAAGLKGQQIKVICRLGEQEVGSEVFTPASARETHPVHFSHIPMAAGFHRLTVTAQCVGGDAPAVEGRKSVGKLVQVLQRQMRILYIEGKFRYEAKYVAQALSAAERFSVDRRIVLSGVGGPAGSGLSDNADDWLSYQAVVLGDVAASQFTPKQLQIIKGLVGDKGKGFCMIGGASSFAGDGWAGTPIADILPVTLPAGPPQIDQPVRVVVSDAGLRNELMMISDTQSPDAAWSSLGALDGANKLGPAKPGASVLATTPQGDPLIVSQNFGAGRSLAIAFDSTWRWVLSPNDTAEMQRRFWRQVAIYLANPKGNIWITTDKSSYDLRRLSESLESIEITAGVENAVGLSAPEAFKEAVLIAPASGATQPAPVGLALERSGALLHMRLPSPSAPGLYKLKISAVVDGKPLSAEHQFEIIQRDLEAGETLADFTVLKQMAAASGGQFAPLRRLDVVLKELQARAKPTMHEEVLHENLSDMYHWPMVVVLIALLCAEWALRKRRGLV